MRQERITQATLFDIFATHEIGRELKQLPPLEPMGTAARGLPKNVFHEKPPFMDGH